MGIGRVQQGVEYAFLCTGREVLSSSELMAWTHVLARYQGRASRRNRQNQSRATIRAADRLCVRAGRARGRGRPWLWRLRQPIG
jgi:hypothetical protein